MKFARGLVIVLAAGAAIAPVALATTAVAADPQPAP